MPPSRGSPIRVRTAASHPSTCALQIACGSRDGSYAHGDHGLALLDTGSSHTIVRRGMLPREAEVSTRSRIRVPFVGASVDAEVVRTRVRFVFGDATTTSGSTDERRVRLLVTDDPLPDDVSAIIGLCLPHKDSHRCSFMRRFGIRGVRFDFAAHTVLFFPQRNDALRHTLLDRAQTLRVNPSMTNYHLTASTPKFARIVFDTGAAHTVAPSNEVRFRFSDFDLSLRVGRHWSDADPATAPPDGDTFVLLGLDAMTGTVLEYSMTSDQNGYRIEWNRSESGDARDVERGVGRAQE